MEGRSSQPLTLVSTLSQRASFLMCKCAGQEAKVPRPQDAVTLSTLLRTCRCVEGAPEQRAGDGDP